MLASTFSSPPEIGVGTMGGFADDDACGLRQRLGSCSDILDGPFEGLGVQRFSFSIVAEQGADFFWYLTNLPVIGKIYF